MPYQLTEENKQYIQENYLKKRCPDLARELDFGETAVRVYLKKIGKREDYKQHHYQPKIEDLEPVKVRDRHVKMLAFAKSKGFKHTAEAVQHYGHKEFIKEFKNRKR